MTGVSTFVSILAMSQLVFLGIYTFVHFRRHRVAVLVLLFSICLMSFLLGRLPVIVDDSLIDMLLGSLASLTPAVLWIFAVSLFRDDKGIPAYGLASIILYFGLQTIANTLDYLGSEQGQLIYVLGDLVPMIVMLGLSIHVIYMGIEGRMADLVEERRRIRMPFVIIMGIVIIFVLLFGALVTYVNVFSDMDGEPAFFAVTRLIISLAVFLWTLLLNLSLFSLRDDATQLFQTAPSISVNGADQSSPTPKVEKDDPLVAKIRVAMEEEYRYRETGFTITGMASSLAVPEQRLRTTINKKLGFRNFNQFLNFYRVKEAAKKLNSTDDPIANIAMEVGYNSLSSFNKAFKESHRMSPRDWRKTEAR